MRKLTHLEASELCTALSIRSNYIETNTVSMSAQDAIHQGKHNIVRSLDNNQQQIIKLNTDLVRAVQEGRVYINDTARNKTSA